MPAYDPYGLGTPTSPLRRSPYAELNADVEPLANFDWSEATPEDLIDRERGRRPDRAIARGWREGEFQAEASDYNRQALLAEAQGEDVRSADLQSRAELAQQKGAATRDPNEVPFSEWFSPEDGGSPLRNLSKIPSSAGAMIGRGIRSSLPSLPGAVVGGVLGAASPIPGGAALGAMAGAAPESFKQHLGEQAGNIFADESLNDLSGPQKLAIGAGASAVNTGLDVISPGIAAGVLSKGMKNRLKAWMGKDMSEGAITKFVQQNPGIAAMLGSAAEGGQEVVQDLVGHGARKLGGSTQEMSSPREMVDTFGEAFIGAGPLTAAGTYTASATGASEGDDIDSLEATAWKGAARVVNATDDARAAVAEAGRKAYGSAQPYLINLGAYINDKIGRGEGGVTDAVIEGAANATKVIRSKLPEGHTLRRAVEDAAVLTEAMLTNAGRATKDGVSRVSQIEDKPGAVRQKLDEIGEKYPSVGGLFKTVEDTVTELLGREGVKTAWQKTSDSVAAAEKKLSDIRREMTGVADDSDEAAEAMTVGTRLQRATVETAGKALRADTSLTLEERNAVDAALADPENPASYKKVMELFKERSFSRTTTLAATKALKGAKDALKSVMPKTKASREGGGKEKSATQVQRAIETSLYKNLTRKARGEDMNAVIADLTGTIYKLIRVSGKISKDQAKAIGRLRGAMGAFENHEKIFEEAFKLMNVDRDTTGEQILDALRDFESAQLDLLDEESPLFRGLTSEARAQSPDNLLELGEVIDTWWAREERNPEQMKAAKKAMAEYFIGGEKAVAAAIKKYAEDTRIRGDARSRTAFAGLADQEPQADPALTDEDLDDFEGQQADATEGDGTVVDDIDIMAALEDDIFNEGSTDTQPEADDAELDDGVGEYDSSNMEHHYLNADPATPYMKGRDDAQLDADMQKLREKGFTQVDSVSMLQSLLDRLGGKSGTNQKSINQELRYAVLRLRGGLERKLQQLEATDRSTLAERATQLRMGDSPEGLAIADKIDAQIGRNELPNYTRAIEELTSEIMLLESAPPREVLAEYSVIVSAPNKTNAASDAELKRMADGVEANKGTALAKVIKMFAELDRIEVGVGDESSPTAQRAIEKGRRLQQQLRAALDKAAVGSHVYFRMRDSSTLTLNAAAMSRVSDPKLDSTRVARFNEALTSVLLRDDVLGLIKSPDGDEFIAYPPKHLYLQAPKWKIEAVDGAEPQLVRRQEGVTLGSLLHEGTGFKDGASRDADGKSLNDGKINERHAEKRDPFKADGRPEYHKDFTRVDGKLTEETRAAYEKAKKQGAVDADEVITAAKRGTTDKVADLQAKYEAAVKNLDRQEEAYKEKRRATRKAAGLPAEPRAWEDEYEADAAALPAGEVDLSDRDSAQRYREQLRDRKAGPNTNFPQKRKELLDNHVKNVAELKTYESVLGAALNKTNTDITNLRNTHNIKSGDRVPVAAWPEITRLQTMRDTMQRELAAHLAKLDPLPTRDDFIAAGELYASELNLFQWHNAVIDTLNDHLDRVGGKGGPMGLYYQSRLEKEQAALNALTAPIDREGRAEGAALTADDGDAELRANAPVRAEKARESEAVRQTEKLRTNLAEAREAKAAVHARRKKGAVSPATRRRHKQQDEQLDAAIAEAESAIAVAEPGPMPARTKTSAERAPAPETFGTGFQEPSYKAPAPYREEPGREVSKELKKPETRHDKEIIPKSEDRVYETVEEVPTDAPVEPLFGRTPAERKRIRDEAIELRKKNVDMKGSTKDEIDRAKKKAAPAKVVEGLEEEFPDGTPGTRAEALGSTTYETVKDLIWKMRGKEIIVIMNRTMEKMGGKRGEHTFTPADGQRMIEIAISIGGTPVTEAEAVSVAYHESAHDLFRMLKEAGSPEARAVLGKIYRGLKRPHIMAQIREHINDPAALEQMRRDPEELAAYAFQLYAQGKIKLTPEIRNFFMEIMKQIREIFKVVSETEFAEHALMALMNKELVVPSGETAQAILDRAGETFTDKLERIAPIVPKAYKVLIKSGTERLRSFNSAALSTLADMFEPEVGTEEGPAYYSRKNQAMSEKRNDLAKILRGTTPEERAEALKNLQLRNPTSPLEKQLDKFIRRMYGYMAGAGARDAEGNTIGRPKNGFPMIWDSKKLLNGKASFFEDMKAHSGLDEGEIDNIFVALTRGDGSIELKDEDTALGWQPLVSKVKDRRFTFMDGKPEALAAMAKYQKSDLEHVLYDFSDQAVHRAEYARAFGHKSSEITRLLAKAEEEGVTKDELVEVQRVIAGLTGALGNNMNPLWKSVSGVAITAQNTILLPLAIFSQMLDPMGIGIRTGKWSDAGGAFKRGLNDIKKVITRDKTRDWNAEIADFIGAIEQQDMLEVMGYTNREMGMPGWAKWWNNKFFKYNGMQIWNNSMRTHAVEAGVRWLSDNRDNKSALHELGLEPGDLNFYEVDGQLRMAVTMQEIRAGDPSLVGPKRKMPSRAEAEASASRIQEALFQFVDQAVVRPNAAHRPVWMSDPRFMVVSHLKQFTFSFHNIILQRAIVAAEKGDNTPTMMLLAGAPVMFAADMAKWTLTGSVPQSWDALDHMTYSMQRAGLFGKGEFLVDVVEDAIYGRVPGISLAGPSIEHGAQLLDSVVGDEGSAELLERSMPLGKYILR